MALNADGTLIYSSANTLAGSDVSAYAVNPATGAVASAPVSTLADSHCCNDLLDPSGSVVIDYAPSSRGGVSVFLTNLATGALTPAQGLSSHAFVSATIIRIP